jgi:small basic protein
LDQEKLMTIFGKRLSDYVAFTGPFLGLILVVGILRLALSLGGVPNSTTKWLSITVAVFLGTIYSAIRIHTTGFGSYRQLLVAIVLMNWTSQAISIVAVMIAIFTGTDNVYSAPEYSPSDDGKTWLHAGAHLLIGTTVGSLVPWAIGSLIMFVTKRVTNREKATAGYGA